MATFGRSIYDTGTGYDTKATPTGSQYGTAYTGGTSRNTSAIVPRAGTGRMIADPIGSASGVAGGRTAGGSVATQANTNYNYDPYQVTGTGYSQAGDTGLITQNAYESQQQSTLDAQQQAARDALQQQYALEQMNKKNAFDVDRRRSMLQEFSSIGGTPLPTVQYDTAGQQAADNAAFARAKEMAGQNAQAAVQALKGAMDSRGMTGSTVEGQALSGVVGGAGQDISQFLTNQAMQTAEGNRRRAETQYQGNITQRGQDLDAQRAIYNLMMSAY